MSNSSQKINEIKNQFNNVNIPQQQQPQNNLQAYNQGIQYLLQNNPQANNYLLNQAQIMKNQRLAEQNATNDHQKMKV